MSGLLHRWHKRWLNRHLPLIRDFQETIREAEIHRAGRILDWIGVAGGMDHSERVLYLAIEMACKQGYSFEEAERLARARADSEEGGE
jgi:hypothetical protein